MHPVSDQGYHQEVVVSLLSSNVIDNCLLPPGSLVDLDLPSAMSRTVAGGEILKVDHRMSFASSTTPVSQDLPDLNSESGSNR